MSCSNSSTIVHTVTFDSQGGSPIESQRINHGEKVTKPEDPVRTGYNFVNWTYKDEEWSFLGYSVTEDMTLVANWDIITYQITYISQYENNANNPYNYTVEDNIVLNNPIKEGYSFLGWYDSDNNQVTSIFRGTTGNICLTAKWNDGNEYTITLDTSGGEVSELTINVQYDHYYSLPTPVPPPELQNYVFDGWYIGDTKIPDSGIWNYTDTKVVAKWRSTFKINDGVLTITDNTITSFVIPDTVTSIGAYAFTGCQSITSIFIPDSVTSIGAYAFNGCTSLTSISIPDTVTSIGKLSFTNCPSLQYNEYDNAYYLGNAANPYVCLVYAKDTSIVSCTINENCKIVYYNAFNYCASLTSISIPDSVVSLGEGSFSRCSSLTSVSLGKNIISIGTLAFSYCTNLVFDYHGTLGNWLLLSGKLSLHGFITHLHFDGSNQECTEIVVPNGVISIDSYAFTGCQSITSIFIPDSVTSIGAYAFERCNALTSINIPNFVTTIGTYAFTGCQSITSLTIPDSVVSIGEGAFGDCTSLQYNDDSNGHYLGNADNLFLWLIYVEDVSMVSFNINENCKYIYHHAFTIMSVDGRTSLTSISIPNSIISIGDYAFHTCTAVTSLSIPDSVISIGAYAFSQCRSITSLTIPDSVVSIGQDAFEGCLSLQYTEYDNAYYLGNDFNPYLYLVRAKTDNRYLSSCLINDNCKFVYHRSFSGLKYLESIVIPNGVISIGDYAFSGCEKMKSINISETVVSIGDYAFDSCKALTSITIPESVISIGSGAFNNCKYLNCVVVPTSVTTIGYTAFYGCTSLTSVYYKGTKSDLDEKINVKKVLLTWSWTTIYYFSETEPSTSGSYWHYVDGVPTVW